MKTRFLAFLALWAAATLHLTGCGSPTAPESTNSSAVAPASQSAGPDSVAKKPAAALDPRYTMLTNLEMVEYCLPYPADEYKEDYEAAEEKGQHVLLSKDKKHKIIFSGNPTDTELLILYHDTQAEVQEITMKDPRHDEMGEDFFEISWQEGNKMVWLRKWYRKEAQETVTARFEYPAKDSASMESMIQVVAAASSLCE